MARVVKKVLAFLLFSLGASLLYTFLFTFIKDLLNSINHGEFQLNLPKLAVHCSMQSYNETRTTLFASIFLLIRMGLTSYVLFASKSWMRYTLWLFMFFDIGNAISTILPHYAHLDEFRFLYFSQSLLDILGECAFNNKHLMIYFLAAFNLVIFYLSRRQLKVAIVSFIKQ